LTGIGKSRQREEPFRPCKSGKKKRRALKGTQCEEVTGRGENGRKRGKKAEKRKEKERVSTRRVEKKTRKGAQYLNGVRGKGSFGRGWTMPSRERTAQQVLGLY